MAQLEGAAPPFAGGRDVRRNRSCPFVILSHPCHKQAASMSEPFRKAAP